MVTVSDLRLNGRVFNPWSLHYRSVGTRMDNHLRVSIPLRYVTSLPGQLSILPSVGPEISTGQSVVMCCRWGSKAGWLIPFVDKDVGGR